MEGGRPAERDDQGAGHARRACPPSARCIGEGINVNVTLLFARDAYEAVAAGVHRGPRGARRPRASPSASVASVASFFVSRIDTRGGRAARGEAEDGRPARTRRGSRACWARSRSPTPSSPTRATRRSSPARAGRPSRRKGAQTQRVLWASTGTKNPRYRDVLYVEELIGPDTVNTVPPETLAAFRDHGRPRPSLEEDVARRDGRRWTTSRRPGISLEKVTDDLLADGLKKFVEPFTKLLKAVERRCREANKARINAQTLRAARRRSQAEVDGAARRTGTPQGGTRRLWAGDASLWTGSDEASWIGWLGIVEQQLDDLSPLDGPRRPRSRRRASRTRCCSAWAARASAPRSGRRPSARSPGSPELLVLDSTDPAQVKAIEEKIDLDEDAVHRLQQVRLDARAEHLQGLLLRPVKQALGADEAGSRFVAVTDPGSNLEKEAAGRRLPPHLPRREDRSAAATRRCPTSAWCRRRSWASTCERLLDEAERMLARLRARRARGGEPRPRARHDPRRGRATRASTS